MFTVFLLILDLLLILSFAFTPYITRKTELFGVSLPSEHINDPELVRLKAAYRNQLLALGLIPLAVSLVIGLLGDWSSPPALALWLVVVFAYLLASFLLYLPKHRQMKRIKAEQNWVEKTEPAVISVSTSPAKADFISPAWLLLFVLVLALGMGAVALVWPHVPDPVPMHYNIDGVVDRTAPKSLTVLAPMLVVELFLALILSAVFFIMRRSRRQIDAAKPQQSLEQDRRFRRISSIFMVALGVFILLVMEGLQLVTLLGMGKIEWVFLPVIALIVVIGIGIWYLMFRVGQGGARLAQRPLTSVEQANYDDDRFWKLGLFYFNPNDPAWVVEKRFGVGWTANLARPMTWFAIGILVVAVIALLVVTFLLAGTVGK